MWQHIPTNSISLCHYGIPHHLHMVQIHRCWLLTRVAKPCIIKSLPSYQSCTINRGCPHVPTTPSNALHEANRHHQKVILVTPVPQTKTNDKTHHVYITITNLSGKLYSDQTGLFLVTSSRVNFYVVIFYTLDRNHIKSYPIKFWHRNELLKSYEEVYSYLRFRVYRPQLHKSDNETFRNMESFIPEK